MPNFNDVKTLKDLLLKRSSELPNQVGYTFLMYPDNVRIESKITYSFLDKRAQIIASKLLKYAAYGDRALLLFDNGPEYIAAFFACMYCGVIAVPSYPPRKNNFDDRIRNIMKDCIPKVILTSSDILSDIEKADNRDEVLTEDIAIIATDILENDHDKLWKKIKVKAEDVAFLQYTSGSTGIPKGVVITNKNILTNLKMISVSFGHSNKTVGVGWLPMFHDMGLIGNVLSPIYSAFPVYLMSPGSFLKRPMNWLQAISDYKATTSGGPNFAYDLCLSRITEEEKNNLDLSKWDLAFTGAEPVRYETLEKFYNTFQKCGFKQEAFYPCYGMAEATLMISGGKKSEKPIVIEVDSKSLQENKAILGRVGFKTQHIVSCGEAILQQKLYVVNPKTHVICKEGKIGEIWVSGNNVAQGYWNDPKKTQETFKVHIKNGDKKNKFLRTGDLGFIKNGQLFFTGRLKDLIIVNGQNFYPQDIELVVENSNSDLQLNASIAFSIEEDGKERLVIVQEIRRTSLRKFKPDLVVEDIINAVGQKFGLTIYKILLVKTNSIPKTSSGKVQRSLCKQMYQTNELTILSEWCKKSVNSDSILKDDAQSKSRIKADSIIEWLRDYCKKKINSVLINERRSIPPYIVSDFARKGILGMQIPEEYGGINLTFHDSIRVVQQIAAIDLTIASFVGVNCLLGTRPIVKYANEEVKKEILPLIAQGHYISSFAITELGAGSNPRAITSIAKKTSEGWILNGKKIWIGNGSWSGVTNVFLKAQNENNEVIGMVGFVVKQELEGFKNGPEALTLGMKGMVQNSIFFDDLKINSKYLLGDVGQGMEVAQDTMMLGRLGISAMCLGAMKRSAQIMVKFSSSRKVSTGILLENSVTLEKLEHLTKAISGLEIFTYGIAKMLDESSSIPEEIYAAIKIIGPELAWQGADDLVQLMGGRGYVETNIAAQILRDVRIFRIFEGPTEALRVFLGSKAINNNIQSLHHFITNDLSLAKLAEEINDAVLKLKNAAAGSKKFLNKNNISQLCQSYLGELLSWFILAAFVRKHTKDSEGEALELMVWINKKIKQKFDFALQELTDNVVVDAEKVVSKIKSYLEAIGNPQQNLPGEDYLLDQTLVIDSSVGNELSFTAMSVSEVSEKTNNLVTTRELKEENHDLKVKKNNSELERWMTKWISKELNIKDSEINKASSFMSLGLDSVTAASFISDLESYLKQRLDINIIWDNPDIESLAKYLTK